MYFYLYLFIDLYSRKIVGWQVYDVKNSERENIARGQVTLHSDNDSPMKGVTMRAILEQLGVMPSFGRPAVSNDNPGYRVLWKGRIS
jgi:transposase InsO family protein